MNNLHRELSQVLNRNNIDSLLETPDHVLATMLVKHLDALGHVIAERKRLAKGGPFEEKTEAEWRADLKADEHGRTHEEQALVNMDRAIDSEYPSNKIDPI